MMISPTTIELVDGIRFITISVSVIRQNLHFSSINSVLNVATIFFGLVFKSLGGFGRLEPVCVVSIIGNKTNLVVFQNVRPSELPAQSSNGRCVGEGAHSFANPHKNLAKLQTL